MRHNASKLIRIVFVHRDARKRIPTSFPGGNSEREPPDPIPNSEVKTFSADGSVGSPHVRVGHRQDLISKSRSRLGTAFFLLALELFPPLSDQVFSGQS